MRRHAFLHPHRSSTGSRSSAFFAAALAATALLASSCASPSDDPATLAMSVRWSLTDPAAPIPAGVDLIELTVFREGEEPAPSACTVAGLMEGGREGRRACVREELPTGVPFTLGIFARSGPSITHVAYAGPLVLSPGQRLFIEPTMFPVGLPQAVSSFGANGRFLHTSAALPDGRVLISGGFETATTMLCPGSAPADSRCFSLVATQTALVFDPANARFYRVTGNMLEARGGHTSTVLPDGRVLLAGGAASAILILTPLPGGATGFSIDIQPSAGGLATFEIFDPEANPELDDVDADGDAGRGGFVGAADDATSPGRLDAARFMATAALVPGTSRVVISGGVGAAGSYAVFDLYRQGGYGVVRAEGAGLTLPRVGAGSVGLGSGSAASVWIFGGGSATNSGEIAEVWTAGSDADGETVGGMMAGFPGGATERPEWNLFRPLVFPIGGGTHAAVVGWLGPVCAPGTATPIFHGVTDPVVPCNFVRSETRSFTVDAATGVGVATPTSNPHAFGAVAILADGRAVVTGGITSLIFDANNTTEVFAAALGPTGAAQSSAGPPMAMPRAFHTSVGLEGNGVLSVGGLRITADGRTATIVSSAEVFYFQPATL